MAQLTPPPFRDSPPRVGVYQPLVGRRSLDRTSSERVRKGGGVIPLPLEPSAVLVWHTHAADHTSWKHTGDGTGARRKQEMLVATRTQHPAKRRDTGSQEVVG